MRIQVLYYFTERLYCTPLPVCHTYRAVYDSELISLHLITTHHNTPLHLWTLRDLFRQVIPTVELFIHSFIHREWVKQG